MAHTQQAGRMVDATREICEWHVYYDPKYRIPQRVQELGMFRWRPFDPIAQGSDAVVIPDGDFP